MPIERTQLPQLPEISPATAHLIATANAIATACGGEVVWGSSYLPYLPRDTEVKHLLQLSTYRLRPHLTFRRPTKGANSALWCVILNRLGEVVDYRYTST